MNLRRLAFVLFFGIVASVAYSAGSNGGAEIQSVNDQQPFVSESVFKSASLPESNAVDSSSYAINGGSAGNVIATVPEPSATMLVCLGLVGFAAFTLRRISVR